VGGAEISLRLLLERLDTASFRPLILHAPGADWLRDLPCEDGALTCEVFRDRRLLEPRRRDVAPGLLGNLGKLAAAVRPVLEMRRVLRSHGAALVHSNTLKCHLLAGAAARAAGTPVVWHMRDIVTEPGPRAMLRRAAALVRPTIIAISQAVAEQVRDLAPRVEVIYNGVPLEHFQPGPEPDGLRRELGLGSRHRVVMIVARLTPWKGHAELLRALPRVVNRFPDARLVVVGTTNFWQAEYLDELQALAEDQGVGHAVLWTGHRQDIPELLRLCEMLVLPSRDEPFGRSLVEAMATGKPVVAGRGGAAPEICPDGLCGYLVDHDDPAEIADGLLALLTDPERAAEMGRAGRRRALDLFDADANAERVQALYRDLLH